MISLIVMIVATYPTLKLLQMIQEAKMIRSIESSQLVSPVIISLNTSKIKEQEVKILKKLNPFGVILYKQNIKSYQQIKKFTKDIKSVLHDREVIVAIDQEGGLVNRLSAILPESQSKKLLKKASYYAKLAKNNLDQAKKEIYQDSKYTAKILNDLGINLNLAPMVDISKSIESGPIAHRVYGEDPRLVIALAESFIKGMQEEGVKITLKHAPGIGSGVADSHKSDVIINKNKKDIIAEDLLPFKKLAKISDFVLASHATFTKIDNKPTTMSRKTIDFFKKHTDYKGIIISDALNMKAVTKEHGSDRDSIEKYQNISEKIFNSGVDIIISNCMFLKCELGVLQAAHKTQAIKRINKKL